MSSHGPWFPQSAPLTRSHSPLADALKSMDNVWAKRLRLFLLFKATFYKAYVTMCLWVCVLRLFPHITSPSSTQMYCYTGIQLMTEEKCGEAVRALQEAQKSKADLEISFDTNALLPASQACKRQGKPPKPM